MVIKDEWNDDDEVKGKKEVKSEIKIAGEKRVRKIKKKEQQQEEIKRVYLFKKYTTWMNLEDIK